MSGISRGARLPLAAVVAAIALVSLAAHAADPAPARKGTTLTLGGKGQATGKLLTRNELRECLAQEGRVRALSDEAVAQQRALEAEKAEIVKQGNELKQALSTVDASTPAEQIAAYKAKGSEQDQRVDAYNAKLPAFNSKVQAMQTERSSFAQNCADRPYDEGDYFAVKRGK